jgi:hypothetical protein
MEEMGVHCDLLTYEERNHGLLEHFKGAQPPEFGVEWPDHIGHCSSVAETEVRNPCLIG